MFSLRHQPTHGPPTLLCSGPGFASSTLNCHAVHCLGLNLMKPPHDHRAVSESNSKHHIQTLQFRDRKEAVSSLCFFLRTKKPFWLVPHISLAKLCVLPMLVTNNSNLPRVHEIFFSLPFHVFIY